MLQVTKLTQTDRDGIDPSTSPTESMASYLQVLRRQFSTVLLILLASFLLAVLYLFTAVPEFTSTASMVIDTRKVQLFQQQSILGDIGVDSAAIETQVEILKSENISLAVIKDLRLIEDPEFISFGGGLTGAVLGLFETPGTKSEFDLTRTALGRFAKSRTIKRLGLTYVMEIGFTSSDPQQASRIANAIADAYIVDQLEAKYQATRRASVWLQDRIKELRMQTSAAQRSVVDFKQTNNIVDTGGRLMNEQQLAEVNSQLIMTRAATAEAKARLDRINDIIKQEIPDASVADALKNETIVKLRGQYVDMASREAIWSAKYGREHLAALNLRTQMAEIKRNITDELRRIQQSYKSDYDIALTREESIKGSLSGLVSESQSTNQAQIQLRELESNAQSYQAMYDNFLQRYMESVQQQSFPITEARLISPASKPMQKSYPKSLNVLAASLFGGLILSFGAAMARELADNVFRTGSQIEDVLSTNCIAIVPDIRSSQRGAVKLSKLHKDRADRGATDPALLRHVIEQPLSRFSEAIRSLKVAIDMNSIVRENRVIAVTSTLPNEGKSTIATNLAQIIAYGGARVVLIDCDLRNPSLSRELAPKDAPGLVDVVGKKIQFQEALVVDSATRLAFLPAGSSNIRLLHTSEILASKSMTEFIASLKTQYDYIILDMPPMAPVVDVRVTSNYVESYVFVVQWGSTTIDVVKHNLKGAPELYNRLLGVILNKADTKLLARYESYQGKYYYSKYYARYGYTG